MSGSEEVDLWFELASVSRQMSQEGIALTLEYVRFITQLEIDNTVLHVCIGKLNDEKNKKNK